MCGIIAAIGERATPSVLIDMLKRREYRGYSSAVVDGGIERRRAKGQIRELEAMLAGDPLSGTLGIGHTRWTTHGASIRSVGAPDCHPLIAPLVYTVPVQLLAYYTAVQKGTDVDQPQPSQVGDGG